jgi:hypothetical protein
VTSTKSLSLQKKCLWPVASVERILSRRSHLLHAFSNLVKNAAAPPPPRARVPPRLATTGHLFMMISTAAASAAAACVASVDGGSGCCVGRLQLQYE